MDTAMDTAPPARITTYRALAALLSYPEQDVVDALPELFCELMQDARLPPAVFDNLACLMQELGETELLELQERYVSLFDRSRALSLHLFEHVHGESRDRGQAMVELAALYAAQGLQVADHELPDFLPAFLEFLSLAPPGQANELLADVAHILAALRAGLERRESRYAAVLEAALALTGEAGAPNEQMLSAIKAAAADPAQDSNDALDLEWAEQPVLFGAGPPGSCGAPEPDKKPVHIYRKGMPA